MVMLYGSSTLTAMASIKEVREQTAPLDMVRELIRGHEAVARNA
tara:strand:- start:67 stop:198 length:132 start_codon:yes stop_codon:yes gene_type:complete